MEAWPAVAWVLLVASVADWLKTVQGRDFSVMDIIMLHPSSKELLFFFSPFKFLKAGF